MLEKRSTITWMGMDHCRCADLDPTMGFLDSRKSRLKPNLKYPEVLIFGSGHSGSLKAGRDMGSNRACADATIHGVYRAL